ncbi:MAG TPA: hypothetical protein VFR02_07765 [bacterium]|nr:hypothetical protein [bacterium]
MKKEHFIGIFILYALLFAAGHWPVWREVAAALREGTGHGHPPVWAEGWTPGPGVWVQKGSLAQEEVEKTRS